MADGWFNTVATDLTRMLKENECLIHRRKKFLQDLHTYYMCDHVDVDQYGEFILKYVGIIGQVFHCGKQLIICLRPKYGSLMPLVKLILTGREVKIARQDVFILSELIPNGVNSYFDYLVCKATIVGRKPFICLECRHYSVDDEYYHNDGICIYQTENWSLYRGRDGYLAYGVMDQELIDTIKNMPLQHLNQFQYKTESMSCDTDQLLAQIRQDILLCESEEIYRKLLFSIQHTTGAQRLLSMNYLRLSHYMIYRERASTRAFVVSGEPGVGKTHFVKTLVGVNQDVYYYRADPKAKKFWDGYIGQDVVVIDDLGHYSSDEWRMLIHFVSDTPVFLPMVNPHLIDRVPFVSSTIIITTNCLQKLFDLETVTRHAICRRIEFIEFGMEINYRLFHATRGLVNVCKFTRDELQLWMRTYVIPKYEFDANVNGVVYMVYRGLHYLQEIPYYKYVMFFIDTLVQCVSLAVSSKLFKTMERTTRLGRFFVPRAIKMIYYGASLAEQSRIRRLCNRSLIFDILSGHGQYDRGLLDKTLVSESSIISCQPGQDITHKTVYGIDTTSLINDLDEIRQHVQTKEVVRKVPDSIVQCTTNDEFGGLIQRDHHLPGYEYTERYIKVPSGYKLSPLYDCDKWIKGTYLPVSPLLVDKIDQSEWRPFLPYSIQIRKTKVVNLLQQLINGSKSHRHTCKRKEERRRRKFAMLDIVQ